MHKELESGFKSLEREREREREVSNEHLLIN